ncbi:MAG: hypothetical protein CMJ92_00515 [Planctomycetes bacterium]|nr:hypothetical protein [Planctomycetota bacterium]
MPEGARCTLGLRLSVLAPECPESPPLTEVDLPSRWIMSVVGALPRLLTVEPEKEFRGSLINAGNGVTGNALGTGSASLLNCLPRVRTPLGFAELPGSEIEGRSLTGLRSTLGFRSRTGFTVETPEEVVLPNPAAALELRGCGVTLG